MDIDAMQFHYAKTRVLEENARWLSINNRFTICLVGIYLLT